MKPSARFFHGIVAAQAFFLLGWAGLHESARQQDEVFLLRGRPVDPQDLLRGDYMVIGYDIGNVSVEGADTSDHRRREIWVLLERRGRYYEAVRASHEKLHPAPGQILVRGSNGGEWTNFRRGSHVVYGIEKFFVPEGKGTPRFNLLEVEVTVGPGRQLQIKRVLLDGTPYP